MVLFTFALNLLKNGSSSGKISDLSTPINERPFPSAAERHDLVATHVEQIT